MSIEIEVTTPKVFSVQYLRVSAAVRYWEDSSINGVEDLKGDLTPLRVGSNWCPTIDLETGLVMDWPMGTTASIHFKVCDQGEYWLQDADRKDTLKWAGSYVPYRLLCVGDRGYGDYIILNIDEGGLIQKWNSPDLDGSEWEGISV